MLPEVLVVDDDENAAKNYADLISARTKVMATFTSSASAAEKLMQDFSFKVVVLDQKMPNVSGTALFERLRSINPAFKAVMLTGEADADEIGRAMQLGYSDYLHKGRVSELPGRVANELLKFHLDAAHKEPINSEVLVAEDIAWNFLRRHFTKIFLVSSFVLDEHFVRENEWTTSIHLKAGETLKATDKISTSRKIRLEQNIEEKLTASLGSDKLFNILSAKIESHLAEKYNFENTITNQAEYSVERTYSLPKEPEKPDAPHVVSRAFQRAPVYRRVQLFLRITCSSCRRNEIISFIVSQPNGEVATRNYDTLLRGERIVPTGVHKFGNS